MLSDQVQAGPEFVCHNQFVNPMRELWRRENEMEIESRIVQLCINVSTWIMMTILGLKHIQVKEEIVRIMIGIRQEGRRNFGDQRTNMHSISRLILGIVCL